jgi:hypothetical protein
MCTQQSASPQLQHTSPESQPCFAVDALCFNSHSTRDSIFLSTTCNKYSSTLVNLRAPDKALHQRRFSPLLHTATGGTHPYYVAVSEPHVPKPAAQLPKHTTIVTWPWLAHSHHGDVMGLVGVPTPFNVIQCSMNCLSTLQEPLLVPPLSTP